MKLRKLVCGVGINDADYVVQRKETVGYMDGKRKRKIVWICPYYRTWASMIVRCYSDKSQDRCPTYRGCSVSAEWHIFSNFKNWMMTQDWEGKQLDKDLFFEGNKVYSASTCVFVTQAVNSFTTDRGAARGKWQIGVYWNEKVGKFKSHCRNPFTKKQEYLGLFSCPEDAYLAWKAKKAEHAKRLAEEQTDERVKKALKERYPTPE